MSKKPPQRKLRRLLHFNLPYVFLMKALA